MKRYMEKNKPIRKCIVCREHATKDQMLRIVRYRGAVQIDLTGKMNGRGAYVCRNATCIQQMIDKNYLSRALRCKIPTIIIDQIKEGTTYNENS